MKFSLRIASAIVGVALAATACGGPSSKPVALPRDTSQSDNAEQAQLRQLRNTAKVDAKAVQDAANAKAAQDAANAKAAQDAANAKAVQDAANAKAAAAKVTLGVPWAHGTTGYGTARPSEISSGGDPSGSVSNFTWTSWGGAQATGTGTASYGAGNYGTCTAWKAAHPGSPEDCSQRVPIVAYSLSDCNGHPGYHSIEWYFPLAGQTRNLSQPSYSDICEPYSSVVPATPTTVPSPAVTVAPGTQKDVATKAVNPVDVFDKGRPQAYALAFADSGAVNLHRKPAVSSAAFSQLATGTYMTVHCSERGDTVVNDVGRSSDVWYFVSLNEGMDGFMSSVFIDFATGNTSWVAPVCPVGTGGY